MLRFSSIIIVLTALSACSTAIIATKPFDDNIRRTLNIADVSVDAKSGSGATTTLIAALRSSVLQKLSAKTFASNNAGLHIVILKADIKSAGNRAMIGAFAGSNKLNVAATIKSLSDGKTLAEFEIKGDYNPGGFGAFSNPETSTAENVAEALVAEIFAD
jgi:hypothetical protein